MKKKLILIGVFICAIVIIPLVVKAVQVPIATSDQGANVTTFTTSYDAVNDVNNVTATITMNTSNINSIIAQVSGTGASLGSFYYRLTPTLPDAAIGYFKRWFRATK